MTREDPKMLIPMSHHQAAIVNSLLNEHVHRNGGMNGNGPHDEMIRQCQQLGVSLRAAFDDDFILMA